MVYWFLRRSSMARRARQAEGLRALVTKAPGEQAEVGSPLNAVRAYLTQQSQALQAAAPAPLAFSRAKLDEAAQVYARDDREDARRLATSAYLEAKASSWSSRRRKLWTRRCAPRLSAR